MKATLHESGVEGPIAVIKTVFHGLIADLGNLYASSLTRIMLYDCRREDAINIGALVKERTYLEVRPKCYCLNYLRFSDPTDPEATVLD